MSASYAALALVTNNIGQAIILHPGGWTVLPDSLQLTVIKDALAVRDKHGVVLGFLDGGCAQGLAVAREVFVGDLAGGVATSRASVVISWPLMDGVPA